MAAAKKKQPDVAPKAATYQQALTSWKALNDFLRTCSESAAERLLKDEHRGKRRQQFLTRIHSRLNKVRADRERKELTTAKGLR